MKLKTVFAMCRLFLFLLLLAGNRQAYAETSAFDLDLEALMQIEVSSVSRKAQKLKNIPASIHVITSEDIKRSGAGSIPEILRLAPGVQVMSISHNRWAVSIRGGAREYSNKLLVMIDGRSLYSPSYSGVLWEFIETPIENISRIEVIRGPGASMWGSNAVNGVINIITKNAAETTENMLVLSTGNKLRSYGFLRYGFRHSRDTDVRIHLRGFDVDHSKMLDGRDGQDKWTQKSGGFRVEKRNSVDNRILTIQGNFFDSRADDESTMFFEPPAAARVLSRQKSKGFNLTSRWENSWNDGRATSLNLALESGKLNHILFDESRDTLEIEYTSRFSPHSRHDLVWGVGSRITRDNITGSSFMGVPDPKQTKALYRLFFNDEITLKPDRLSMFLSAGLEHNPYTGFEFQPSLRLIHTPDERNSIWIAWSKASRIPSRLERGADYIIAARTAPIPLVAKTIFTDVDSEKLSSIDYGWKRKFGKTITTDLSGFYFKYENAVGANQTGMAPTPAGYLVVTRMLNNRIEGEFRGFEASLDWNPTEKFKLQGTYSYLNINTSVPADSDPLDIRKNVPERIYSLFARYDLGKKTQFDLWYRHYGPIEFGEISAHGTLDAHIAWQAADNLSISLNVYNALDKKHQEFSPRFVFSSQREFGRRISAKTELHF